MKHTLILLLLTPLFAISQSQRIHDEMKHRDSLKNWDKIACGCKCWIFTPQLKNKSNSPLFDSSFYKTRSFMFFKDKKSDILFTLIQDSIEYLHFTVRQYQSFRQKAVISKNQTFMIEFTDSTNYTFKIPEIYNKRYIEMTYSNDYQIDEFTLVLTDSLKMLLTSKTLKGIWINNQNSSINIPDRYFKALSENNTIIKQFFCCFNEQKKRYNIK